MKLRTLAYVLVIASFMSGCGGGGSTPTSAGNPSVIQVGDASVTYSGLVHPAVADVSGNTTIVSLSGAVFSSLMVSPGNTLANTSIAFDQGGAIKVLSMLTNTVKVLTPSGFQANTPNWSRSGNKLVFSMLDPGSNYSQIYSCYADGSGLKQLTNNFDYHSDPSWSTDSTKIIFAAGASYALTTIPAGGGTPVSLQSLKGSNPRYSPTGDRIIYQGIDNNIYEALPDGTSPFVVSKGGIHQNPTFTPDGKAILYNSSGLLSQAANIQKEDATGVGLIQDITVTPMSQTVAVTDSSPTVAPDSSQVAFSRFELAGGFSTISTTSLSSLDAVGSLYSSPTAAIQHPTWSPFLAPRLFVGASGGIFGATVNGLIYAHYGVGFGSLVAFRATTPSSATVTLQSTPGQGAPIYSIQADKLTYLGYTNGYYVAPTASVPNLPAALISFDPANGQVLMTAPYAKSANAPAVVRSGGNLMFSGVFPAVYGPKHENLAPSGATHLVVDAKTGKLLSAR